MAKPNQRFCDWAGRQLLTSIRQGHLPACADVPDFAFDPFLATLRDLVEPSDRELILQMLNHYRSKMWGALLSRGLLEDSEITQELVRLFDTTESEEQQLGLFHHLSARPTGTDVQERLIDWLEEHLDLFIEEQKGFFQPKERVLEAVRSRMELPAYANKRFIYLFSIHAAEDPEQIRSFVCEYIDDPEPLVARSAKRSLDLLRTRHPYSRIEPQTR